MTEASSDLVGYANYTDKTNWRRVDDTEVLREGSILFVAPPSNAACRGMWEAVRPNGQKALVYATDTHLYRLTYSTGVWSTIGSGFTATNRRWQHAITDGWLILNNGVDLPVTFRVEDSAVQPLKEARDVGIAFVDTICAINGFLLLGGVAEIPSANLADVLNGANPYGPIAESQTNHIKYKIVCSDYLKPTNFAPVVTGTIQAANKNQVVLNYPSAAFTVGTKLAVIGAGVEGGTLGGTEGIEDGVPITAINGNTLTLGASADAALTYPLTVQVTRWTDVSTFSSSFSIQDDSSAIVAMVALKRVLVVFRERGIFTGRFTSNVSSPFVFTPEYSGADVPVHPHAIAEVSGDYLLYCSGKRFFYYDGSGAPQAHKVMDDVRGLYLQYATPQTAFSAHNPVTKEVWFVTSGLTLAYDYLKNTVSIIDLAPEACVSLTGAGSEDWFVSKDAPGVTRYALGQDGPLSFKRCGASYTARLSYGAADFGDPLSQKVLRGYTVMLPSGSDNPVLRVTIQGGNDVQDLTMLLEDTINESHDSQTIPMFFRDLNFKDTIEYVDSTGAACRLAGKTFQLYLVDTRGGTRIHNGNT